MKFSTNKKISKEKGATLTGITKLDKVKDAGLGFPKMSSVVDALIERQKGPATGNTAAVLSSNKADITFGESTSFSKALQYDSSLDLRMRQPDNEVDDHTNNQGISNKEDNNNSDGESEFSLGKRNDQVYNQYSTFGIENKKHGMFKRFILQNDNFSVWCSFQRNDVLWFSFKSAKIIII